MYDFFQLKKYQCFENAIISMYIFPTWKVPMFWKYNHFNVPGMLFLNLKSTNVMKIQLFQCMFFQLEK